MFDQFKEFFFGKIGGDWIVEWAYDLMTTWWIIAASTGIAFVLGFIYLFILKYIAGCLIWLSIILIWLVLAAGGAFLYLGRDNYYPEDEERQKYMLYGAYAVWGILALYTLIILCMCKRIRLGVAVIKTAGMFINNNPHIFLVPPIFLVFILLWMAVWIISALFIFSVGEIVPRDDFVVFTTVVWDKTTRYVFLYYLFGFLWLNAFLIGCCQFIIAATCAIWYFSFKSDSGGKGSISTAVKWIFRNHIGSIAFGSFLITVIQFIRIIFEYYRKKAAKGT